MPLNIFNLLGIIGLILIIIGIVVKNKNRKKRDILYIIGGIFLMMYSFHIKDVIFITLQAVFILVAIYDLRKQIKIRKRRK